jgi:hypothetical protein
MSTGDMIKDFLPTPATTDPGQQDISHSLTDEPTDSHALAMANHDDKGAAQVEHDEEVINLGWNERPKDISNPLVGGLGNDNLWVLVRRFNKVCITPVLSRSILTNSLSKCTI